MLPKNNYLLPIAAIVSLLVLVGVLTLPVQVSAAPSMDDSSPNSCLTCHEGLYYLHDMGCWYCVTTHKDRCAGCHEGNPAAHKEEEAHFGMILHPQENNGGKCVECHTTEEAQLKLAEFESVAGFDTVIKVEAYAPSESVVTGFPEVAESNPLENWPWLAGGALFFGFWLALVLFSPMKP
ncbi:MAG: hypothetical protein Q8L87_12340 [Anaerolineales bacterium]|jgi:hypothetical protein|nr:hypothetical protein [Anaerolineales bacterium]